MTESLVSASGNNSYSLLYSMFGTNIKWKGGTVRRKRRFAYECDIPTLNRYIIFPQNS
jgi:hypothetical protein